MTPELKEKLDRFVEILYQNEYIDGSLYDTARINWTDKGEAFMKEKFGQLWSTSWPNFSHPEKIWLPYPNIEHAMEQVKQGTVIDSPRDYWEYVNFKATEWEYDKGNQRYDLLIKILGLNDIDYIELDDLVL